MAKSTQCLRKANRCYICETNEIITLPGNWPQQAWINETWAVQAEAMTTVVMTPKISTLVENEMRVKKKRKVIVYAAECILWNYFKVFD